MVTYKPIQTDSERYLEYIGKHKLAFDIYEDLYPLKLFEDFVKVQGRKESWFYNCCNIDKDQLYPARFTFGYPPQKEAKLLHNPQRQLQEAFHFFRQVANRPEVKLNYRFIHQFFSIHPDVRGICFVAVGVDIRTVTTESRLKLFIGLKDAPDKVETAIALCGDSPTLRAFLLNDYNNYLLVGFDLFFDNHSEIELYPTIFEDKLRRADVRNQITPLLPPLALPLLDQCEVFQIGISQANDSNILYFDDVYDPNSFVDNFGNEMVKKVHAYYRHQPIKKLLVGAPEKDFYARSIEHAKLYYRMN